LSARQKRAGQTEEHGKGGKLEKKKGHPNLKTGRSGPKRTVYTKVKKHARQKERILWGKKTDMGQIRPGQGADTKGTKPGDRQARQMSPTGTN